jgi:amino acid adenylation domain-containing protein
VHHIIADGWSLAALSREVGATYRALVTGENPQTPPLTAQYSDYAYWQAERMRGAEVSRRLDRIRDRLTGVPPLDLRTDLPRPSKPSFRGLLLRRRVPAGVMDAVRAAAASRSASPFMVLLAAFALVLRRHSNQCDFAVGIPVAGRTEAELEPLIGYFVNTVVVRIGLRDEQPFTALVDQVREATLDAYADQNVPFERVLETVSPERDLSRTPIFQVMFNYLSQPAPELPIPGLDVGIVETDRHTAKLDLELYAADTADGGLELALCTSEDLFLRDTAEALLDHVSALIEQAGAAPGRALRELTVPVPDSPGPRRSEPAPVGGTVGERFTARVRHDPQAVAVWTPTAVLSYGALDEQARRVAAAVTAAVPGTGGRVGILCEQGTDVPVALLGVLAAGHAYVPLSPSAPRRWQETLIGIAGLDAIVADPANEGIARELAAGRPVIATVPPAGAEPVAWPPADPDDIAYVLFTSGSTGTPKAVAQSHRNLLHHVGAYVDAVGLGPRDRTTLLSTHTFDAAVLDLFGALLTGATVCPLDVRAAGAKPVRAALAAAGVTVYHSTATVFRLLAAEAGAPPWPATLRTMIFGGEEVRPSDIALVRDGAAPAARIVNLYGCTECSIVTTRTVEPGEPMPRRVVPIGRSVLDTSVRLRDDDGRPAERFGEICVVGRYLSVGYLDEKQTARAYEGAGDERLYRTGDLAWRLPDGSLEFAGRRDDQIKVRGNRVEPGQVESRLRDLPEVADAVVVPVTAPDGEERLTAYVVGAADPVSLQSELHATLPHYMVPSVVVPLPELPSTRTGKVDRNALPEPDWRARAASEAPVSPVEKAIAEVVAEVLGRDSVGRNDNFFALGGQSLQANQVASRLADRLGADVPLRLLFEHPAVSALAAALDATGRSQAGDPVTNDAHNTPIRRSARRMRERTTR